METTVIHPSFVKFIDDVMKNINSTIDTKNYFSLTLNKKKSLNFLIYKTVIKSFSYNVQVTEEEAKDMFNKFRLYNEQTEDYIMAGIFKNIMENVGIFLNPPKKPTRRLKKTNPDN